MADLVNALFRPFIGCRRRAGDAPEPLRLPSPELRNHLLSEAVTEIFLFSVATQVLERQYRQHNSLLGGAQGTKVLPAQVSCHECGSSQEHRRNFQYLLLYLWMSGWRFGGRTSREAAQVHQQFFSRLIAVFGFLLQTLNNDLLQREGNVMF